MIFRLVIHQIIAAIFLLGSLNSATALHSYTGLLVTKAVPNNCSDVNASLIRLQVRKEILALGNVSKNAPTQLHEMAVSAFNGFEQMSHQMIGTQFASKLVQSLASNSTVVLFCLGQASIEMRNVGAKLQSVDPTGNIVGAFSALYEASKLVEPIAKRCFTQNFDIRGMFIDFDHTLPLLPVFLSSLVVGSDDLIKEVSSASCSCYNKDFASCGQKLGLLFSQHLLTENNLNKQTFRKEDIFPQDGINKEASLKK